MKSKWQKWLKINVAAILAAIVMFTTAYGSVDSVDSAGQSDSVDSAGQSDPAGSAGQSDPAGSAGQSDPAGSAELSYSGGSAGQSDAIISVQTRHFNMTYIYFGDPAEYTDRVDNTQGALDNVAPSYFDLNKDGTLRLTGAIDRDFINAMHERGIKVTPFLSNHWNQEIGKKALDNRENLVEQIAEAIEEYDLDGVDIDIENVTHAERDKYTDFVRMLRERLPAGKSISVAVAANPSGKTEGWHASYDLAALSQYCDYLMLMTYDQHYEGVVEPCGGAGPVAGYPFVEESVKAALKEVPPEKLVLGIAFYGRLWKRGAPYGGYGISNKTVEKLIREFRGNVVFDVKQASPKAVITIKPTDRKPVIFGVELEPGTYDIWYENEASIKRKLELVRKYGLKGTGSWSLGQETKETWDYYSLWLEGIYFSDIQRHWAKAHISAAVRNGWMKGVSATRFEPDSPMTRAQAAVLLVRVLDPDISAADAGDEVAAGAEVQDVQMFADKTVEDSPESNVTAVSDDSAFTDTAGHWAQREIEIAAEAGIIKGVGNNRFEPDKVLTREQMAVLLDRLLDDGSGSGSYSPVSFTDVDPFEAWSYSAICRMTAADLIKGFPDGTFRPREAISRGQMAVLIERVAPHLTESKSG